MKKKSGAPLKYGESTQRFVAQVPISKVKMLKELIKSWRVNKED